MYANGTRPGSAGAARAAGRALLRRGDRPLYWPVKGFPQETTPMTSRERFLASMAYEPMDRAPLWDEGIRDDVRERWAIEGLSAGDSLADHFTYDGREEVGFDLMPQPEPSPAPDHAALLRHMRTLYEPTDDRLGDDWDARATEWNERDYVLGIRVWRGLVQPLGVGNFRTLEPAFLSFYDDPDGVAALMSAITDCNVAMCERAVRGFTPDYAVFDEPIAGAYGPVVSPALFRRFCLPHYARLVETLKARGVRWYLVRSYGNPLDLLPVWLDAGINMLWCVEGGSSGVDCVALRREYGRDLRLIGGIDQNLLVGDDDALDAEFARVVAPLVADGGYIPLSDGRIRSNVPWPAYRTYREELARHVG